MRSVLNNQRALVSLFIGLRPVQICLEENRYKAKCDLKSRWNHSLRQPPLVINYNIFLSPRK